MGYCAEHKWWEEEPGKPCVFCRITALERALELAAEQHESNEARIAELEGAVEHYRDRYFEWHRIATHHRKALEANLKQRVPHESQKHRCDWRVAAEAMQQRSREAFEK